MAFVKDSVEAYRLSDMFKNGELSWTATPADISGLFPTLDGKTPTQMRNGFNRVRDNAKAEVLALGSNQLAKRGKSG
jgi:hypothetical protein